MGCWWPDCSLMEWWATLPRIHSLHLYNMRSGSKHLVIRKWSGRKHSVPTVCMHNNTLHGQEWNTTWSEMKHHMVRNETPHGQEWNTTWSGMKHHMVRNETPHGKERNTTWSRMEHNVDKNEKPWVVRNENTTLSGIKPHMVRNKTPHGQE